jgi:predicted RNase H-like HicB family nuclease
LTLVCYHSYHGPLMFINYTARYTKIKSGYFGQLAEWSEVVTEGKDLEDCRAMLRDALQEMILAYRQQGKEILSEPFAK